MKHLLVFLSVALAIVLLACYPKIGAVILLYIAVHLVAFCILCQGGKLEAARKNYNRNHTDH